jgi:cytochrome P450
MNLPPRYREKKFMNFLRNPSDFLYNDTIAPNGEYADIFRFEIFFRRVIVCAHPDCAKHILVDNHRNYGKSDAFKVIGQMLGNGLLNSEGDFWKKQRRLIQPAFHKQRLELVANITVEATERLLQNNLLLRTEKVDFAREMVALTIEIVTKALFGSTISASVGEVWSKMNLVNKVGIKRIRNPFAAPKWVPTAENREVEAVVQMIDRVTMEIIENRRNTQPEDDLLQMLLDVQDEDTGERMSDRQIRDEVITLFVAGHETTVNAIAWAVYELGKNADIYAKAKAEVQTVIGDRKASFDDVMRMPYLANIINETMRLYPPAYAIPRISLEDDEILGYRIPKKTNIMLNVFAIHRHPKYWEEPLVFRPERFENIDLKGDRKYTFFPFGGGPRICIGNNFALMEMTLVLAVLLQCTDFAHDITKPIKEDLFLTLKPSEPIMVGFAQAD